MKYLSKILILFVFVLCFIKCTANNNSIKFSLQQRDPESNKTIITNKYINPSKTAIIVIDMWNGHRCISAEKRVTEMAPVMNNVLKIARQKGMFVINAPSGCMDFYKDTPQRRLAQDAPFVKAPVEFKWNYFNPDREGHLDSTLEKAGCSCDTPEPCPRRTKSRAFYKQNEAIEIAEEDAISDNGQEIYDLLQQRGIEDVIIMGVHTNVCVLGRPFGIRQMVYLGKNVILCRDLTDSYQRNPGKHFEGLSKIIEHIEKYWCPTITSDQITNSVPFRFKNNNL